MSEEYLAVRRVLSNVRSIKAFVRETDFELLQEIKEKLEAAIEDRKAEYEQEKAAAVAKEKKRQELLQLIAGEGFSVDELLGNETAKSARKASTGVKRAAKYEYQLDGVTKQWSGVGRKPKPIQDALDGGASLEDFLIKESSAN